MSNLDQLNEITTKDVKQKDNMLNGMENAYGKNLKEEYSTTEKVIAAIVLAWYLKQEKHTKAYSLGKVDKLMSEIKVEISALAQTEKSELNQLLRSGYKATRISDSDDLGLPYKSQDRKRITEVVRAPWSGLDFKDRINRRYQYHMTGVKEIITSGINHGWSAEKVADELHDKLVVSYNEAMRLARTEMNYVANQSTLDTYTDLGVEYYEYMAVIDSRTSKVCRDLDGKVFKVEDAEVGVNYPPLHPLCRSTTVPRRKK